MAGVVLLWVVLGVVWLARPTHSVASSSNGSTGSASITEMTPPAALPPTQAMAPIYVSHLRSDEYFVYRP